MLDYLIWALIISLFLLSFVGLIFPVIPSSLFLWGGFLLYFFFVDSSTLGSFFWVTMVVLTGILFVADLFANSYFVKQYGGSKWGERGAAIAVIIGSFIAPPFGIIFLPFIVVLLVEIMQKRTFEKAIKAAIGSLLGFFSGTVAKCIIQFAMMVLFFVAI
ncbi:MAG TPA: DUF456 family protein [Bacillota bacterium]|nr:DUF456 family protein [Bacillota bacterium]